MEPIKINPSLLACNSRRWKWDSPTAPEDADVIHNVAYFIAGVVMQAIRGEQDRKDKPYADIMTFPLKKQSLLPTHMYRRTRDYTPLVSYCVAVPAWITHNGLDPSVKYLSDARSSDGANAVFSIVFDILRQHGETPQSLMQGCSRERGDSIGAQPQYHTFYMYFTRTYTQ